MRRVVKIILLILLILALLFSALLTILYGSVIHGIDQLFIKSYDATAVTYKAVEDRDVSLCNQLADYVGDGSPKNTCKYQAEKAIILRTSCDNRENSRLCIIELAEKEYNALACLSDNECVTRVAIYNRSWRPCEYNINRDPAKLKYPSFTYSNCIATYNKPYMITK